MFVHRLILPSYNISGMLHTDPWAPWPGRGEGRHLFMGGFPLQCRSPRQSPGSSGLGIHYSVFSFYRQWTSAQVWTSAIVRDMETLRVVIMIASGRCQCRHLGLVLWHNRDIVTLSRVSCDVMWCQGRRARHWWVTGPGRQTCTHWPAASGSWDEMSWPIPGWSQALMSDLWLPRDLGARHCLGHSHNLYRGYIGT